MNPKVFVALAAAAAACVSVANGDDDDVDGTPVEGFNPGEDPWDCQPTEDSGSGTAPSDECAAKYPAAWFITRTDIDNMCKAAKCLGSDNDVEAGCLLIASRFNSNSLVTASRFCGTKTSLSLTEDVGLEKDIDITKGTPSDPFGRCKILDPLFADATSQRPSTIYAWCGEPDSRPEPITKDPNLCECENCQPGTSGECMYNGKDGPRISFSNFCAEYQGETNECFSGFDSESTVTVKDCCEKDDVATPSPPPAVDDIDCPAKYCQSSGGKKNRRTVHLRLHSRHEGWRKYLPQLHVRS